MNEEEKIKSIETLVNDCHIAHQETIIVQLIYRLEKEYIELAELATMGNYKNSWTHKDVLNYITYET